jgi:DNA-binding MarR family transcriptional regulator
MAKHSLKPDSLLPVDSPDRRRLPVLLRRAWYGLNQAFRRRILHTGITPDQFTALRNLHEAGAEGLIQSQLTGRMSSDPNTIASLVERMKKAGLIDREQDGKDRRAYRIRINADGRKKFQEARKLAVSLQECVMEVIPNEQRETFLKQLNAVADACLEAADKVPKK